MGQLAERCYYASDGGCARTDHALRIQVSVVWSRRNKTKHVGSCAAALTVPQATKEGTVLMSSFTSARCRC